MGMYKVNNFPPYVAGQQDIKQVFKGLPGRHALPRIMASFFLGVKSNAAAYVAKCKPNDGSAPGGTDDRLINFNALVSRIYLRRDGVEKQFNLTPIQAELVYGNQYVACMLNCATLFDGQNIPAVGAAELLFRLDVVFDFTIPGAESPDKFVGGTEQACLGSGWEVSYNANGAALAAVAHANGTATITVKNVLLQADIEPVPHPIVGAPWVAKQDQEPTENYVKKEACLDLALLNTAMPATLDGTLTTISVTNDDTKTVHQQTPGQVADAYARVRGAADGDAPFLLERNCTPVIAYPKRGTPDELQLPMTLKEKTINFQASGAVATQNLVRHYIAPFALNAPDCEAVLKQYGLEGTDWKTLAIRYAGGERSRVQDVIFGTRIIPA